MITKEHIERRVNARLKGKRPKGLPGIGSFYPGNILIIGEQASKPHVNPNLPFTGITDGCSGWLNKLLEERGIDEGWLFWVNALENNGEPINLMKLVRKLKPSRVFALGKIAEKLCIDTLIVHDAVPHPQYWKRFRSKEMYPLMPLLEEAESALHLKYMGWA